ncbi:MAG: hypothetical protein KatS3mg032_0346 [Cyclobacteriaceae bacterium]|nr:MAG: hypothetical protein KatS3mg032_0346 [Cyclobacteriaceae bacterium]
MKNWICILLLLPLMGNAQQEPQNNPRARQKIEAARIAFITERLGLTPEEAEKFWPLYREFVQKRMEMRRQFEQQMKEMRENAADPDRQKKLVEMELQLKQRDLDLEKEYSGKLMQTISPQKLMSLRQAEADFRELVLRQIQQRQLQQQRQQKLQDRNEQRLRQRNN